ncbi:hypothetical protein LIER_32442 [Lithospermum erythrorhizon]|uniref:Uncharacterized protein n=1 Tax=Lithospermum erythrorhizon TaxID=34254 RepID=A0AAV3RUT4_LITER
MSFRAEIRARSQSKSFKNPQHKENLGCTTFDVGKSYDLDVSLGSCLDSLIGESNYLIADLVYDWQKSLIHLLKPFWNETLNVSFTATKISYPDPLTLISMLGLRCSSPMELNLSTNDESDNLLVRDLLTLDMIQKCSTADWNNDLKRVGLVYTSSKGIFFASFCDYATIYLNMNRNDANSSYKEDETETTFKNDRCGTFCGDELTNPSISQSYVMTGKAEWCFPFDPGLERSYRN